VVIEHDSRERPATITSHSASWRTSNALATSNHETDNHFSH
jgi:hypothetical protein